MTRPQKCKRGLRHYGFHPIRIHRYYDPTAEMQKGIKTKPQPLFLRLLYYDPTAEMQKGIKTSSISPESMYSWFSYDPTAEMQKGIKTLGSPFLRHMQQHNDPTAEMQKGIKTPAIAE